MDEYDSGGGITDKALGAKEVEAQFNFLRSGGSNNTSNAELIPEENFLDICSRELLATGCELLELTRKGSDHLVIQKLNAEGRLEKKESKKGGSLFDKNELSAILRFGAERAF
ncbi:DNA helicase [Trifolium repens]|nr:DNA helicase [Trifolium repens]